MVADKTQGVPPPPETTKSAAPTSDDSPGESTPSLLSRKAGVQATGNRHFHLRTGIHTGASGEGED